MKKLLIGVVAGLLVLTGSGLVAQNFQRSELQLNSTAPCEKAQIYIDSKVRPNDLRGRVNRLQVYEYVYANADAFVARLENNNQPNARNMRRTLNTLRTQIDKFKSSYEEYDALRDVVINTQDCTTKTSEFEKSVVQAQAARSRVNQAISSIDEIMFKTFQSELDSVSSELLRTGSAQELGQ